jgi:hypothetical protein
VDERTEARRRSPECVGASGVFGAGRVKVKVWIVEAGWRVDAITSTSRVKESWMDVQHLISIRGINSYLESLWEHFSDLLFAQSTRPLHDLFGFAAFLLLSAACTWANGAAKYFRSPPTTDGTVAMVQTHYRIRVSKGPCMGRLWEARDDIEGGERKGSSKRRHRGEIAGGTSGNDRGTSRGRDRFHTSAMFNTENARGLVGAMIIWKSIWDRTRGGWYGNVI